MSLGRTVRLSCATVLLFVIFTDLQKLALGLEASVNTVTDLNPNVQDERVEAPDLDPLKAMKDEVASIVRMTPPPSICERKSDKSVFVFGKCPDKCQPYTVEHFRICAGMVQFGCLLVPCGSGNFKCSLRKDLSSSVTVCPGDKVVFDSVDLQDLQKVRFSIDLKANPLRTDFYLLSDATGSMATAIATAKSKFLDLVDNFRFRKDVAFGVGFYRDETELSDGFQNLQSISTNIALSEAAVKKLAAVGGRDGDEANLVALYKIATDPSIGWRDRSRKILVYFGDWPGHEPTCVGGKTITRSTVINALRARKITVIAVSFQPPGPGLNAATTSFGCSLPGAGVGQASAITTGTTGHLVLSNNQSQLIDKIGEALRALPKVFDVDESDCIANINSVHSPPLPITVTPPSTTTVTNTLEVKPSVCTAIGPFTCDYKYTENGADLELTTIEVVNVKGCPP